MTRRNSASHPNRSTPGIPAAPLSARFENSEQPLRFPARKTDRQQVNARFARARRLAESAQSAVEALQLLGDCVCDDLGNLLLAQAFLKQLERLPHASRWFSGAARAQKQLTAFQEKQDWDAVVTLSIDRLLRRDSPRAAWLLGLAQACAARLYPEVELLWLRAAESETHDTTVRDMLTAALARQGHFDEAIERSRSTLQHSPSDVTAARLLEVFGILPTLPQAKVGKTVAEVLQEVDRLVDAAAMAAASDLLRRMTPQFGSDLRLVERAEQLTLEDAKQKLRFATRQAEHTPGPETRELVERMLSELQQRELEVCASRSQRYPEDSEIRWELAKRLAESGNLTEAIPRLTSVADSEPHAAEAALLRGECQQRLRRFEDALDCYRKAIALANGPLELPLAYYRAGVLAAAMRQVAEARGYFEQLLASHASFRDAEQRLAELA